MKSWMMFALGCAFCLSLAVSWIHGNPWLVLFFGFLAGMHGIIAFVEFIEFAPQMSVKDIHGTK